LLLHKSEVNQFYGRKAGALNPPTDCFNNIINNKRINGRILTIKAKAFSLLFLQIEMGNQFIDYGID
jgi:hypothetical protein